MRVTNRADKPLGDVVPGVRRAIYFDAAEGSAQLSFGAAEIDPGKEIPVHRHRIGDRYVEEGFFVLEGEGEVRVGEQASPIRAGSFCVMSPADDSTASATREQRHSGSSCASPEPASRWSGRPKVGRARRH